MITPPASGAPRPISGNSNDPKKSVHNAPDIERLHKLQAEKETKVKGWKDKIVLENEHIRAEENTLLKLRIQLNALGNQPKTSAVNYTDTIKVQGLERQTQQKIAEAERQIDVLGSTTTDQTRATVKNKNAVGALVAQKEREEEKAKQHIDELEKEIAQLNLELREAENDDKKIQQEIAKLEQQTNEVPKVNDNGKKIEVLRKNISALQQNLNLKKQSAVQASGAAQAVDLAGKRSFTESKTKLEEQLQLAENRIKAAKDNIRLYERNIQNVK